MKTRALTTVLLAALLLTATCAPLTPGMAGAIQTSASVTCTMVETWCNPNVVISAPERICRLAADVCRGGEMALAVVLPGMTETPVPGALLARRTAPLTAGTQGAGQLPMAYSEWGYWCSHVEGDQAAADLCAVLGSGYAAQVEVSIAVVPAASAGAAD
jgi:hypothetical protein